MIEKSKIWNPTCSRFVVFMDIMGFEDLVTRNSHTKVLKRMRWFRENVIAAIEIEAERRLKSHAKTPDTSWRLFGESVIRPVLFSDSILLVSNDDSLESADYVIFCVSRLLQQCLVEGFPIKGAIAYGKQTADFNKSLYLGQPLIDAYKLQRELYLYGVVLHHTFEQYIDDVETLTEFLQYSNIYDYPTPLKSGLVKHKIVGWLNNQPSDKETLDKIPKLYNTVSGPPRCYVDNTVKFGEWLKNKFESKPTDSSLNITNKVS